jgi:hypothetical protein
METANNHVIVTAPDRYWSDSYRILLVDFDWGLVENIVNPLRSYNGTLAIHIYNSFESDCGWLLDVAAYCDLILMDLNQTTNNDVLKGQLISRHNTWYTGRRDLEKFWPRHTDDPLATIMIKLHQTKEEINER